MITYPVISVLGDPVFDYFFSIPFWFSVTLVPILLTLRVVSRS